MASRDIWSHGGSAALRDLLGAALAALLLGPRDEQPAYFSSPWMTDFPLFDNEFRQFAALFSDSGDAPQLAYSAYLLALSRCRPVRVITVRHPASAAFVAHPVFQKPGRLLVRFAPESYHEKGIVTPLFYIEGSMNLTWSGVYVRDEKVTYHSGAGAAEKIARAYLEFDRLWEQLS
jgi:hypothetical protein